MNPKFHRHPSFFLHIQVTSNFIQTCDRLQIKKKKKNNHWVYLVEVLLWLLHQIDLFQHGLKLSIR